MDVLLSTGEQISMAKLAILLNRMNLPAISLTGWQAGIYTDEVNQNAKIEKIDTTRIEQELKERKIVIVAGFQGISKKEDITTLGRGGSDTTAVAIAAALKAKKCYIFSDVDGVYTTDPNRVTIAKKLETLSYEEMLDIAHEGAKVLHNRCIEVGQKYKIPIITKSTFNDEKGSVITNLEDKMEGTCVQSIVKNDNILFVQLQVDKEKENFYKIWNTLSQKGIIGNDFTNPLIKEELEICFTTLNTNLAKLQDLIEKEWKMYKVYYKPITKISIIGHGINNDASILAKILTIVQEYPLQIIKLEVTETKIAIMFSEKTEDTILKQIHETLIP